MRKLDANISDFLLVEDQTCCFRERVSFNSDNTLCNILTVGFRIGSGFVRFHLQDLGLQRNSFCAGLVLGGGQLNLSNSIQDFCENKGFPGIFQMKK